MIYLDYAATTPVDKEVLDGYYELCSNYFGNAASTHALGREANSFLKAARKQIGLLLGVDADEVFFTSGATEANNLAIQGVAFANQKKGKHLITSKVEHPSVKKVFAYLEENFNFEVTYLNVDENGQIRLEELKTALRADTTLVSIMGVNNEIGTIMDIPTIAKIIKENSTAYFHVDATQMIGKISFDSQLVDLFSFSAHKIHGLKGSGALIKKKHVKWNPLLQGGSQENGVRPGTVHWQADVILAKALRKALEAQKEHYESVKKLQVYLIEALAKFPMVYLNSTPEGSPYIVNFSCKGYPSEVVVSALEEAGYLVSTVSACSLRKLSSSYVIEALQKEKFRSTSSIRVSLDSSVSIQNLENFVQTLETIFKRISGGNQ